MPGQAENRKTLRRLTYSGPHGRVLDLLSEAINR